MREIKKLYGRDVDDLMADNFNYQSPIEIMYSKFNTQIENQIMTAVQNVGVNVDKDELVKALEYDRKQYEQGFADALKCVPEELTTVRHGRWVEESSLYDYCSRCRAMVRPKDIAYKSKFCLNCGAKMDLE